MKRTIIVIATLIAQATSGNAQNSFPPSGSAGIGTASPNGSSLLEINSTTQGLLIPRMTGVQRRAITSPATGLLVYQTDSANGFYYYNFKWIHLSPASANTSLSNLTAKTAVNHSLQPDITGTKNLGSPMFGWKDIYATGSLYINDKKILNAGGTGNTLLGEAAGIANTTGSYNTASGENALSYNTTGFKNTATGSQALHFNTTGFYNTADGVIALTSNTSGIYNTASGFDALGSNTSGGSNTASGSEALYSNITGSFNTANGLLALAANTVGSNNTASGDYALDDNTTGNYNTADGDWSLASNSTGNHNTATGRYALVGNTKGNNNTASGANALFDNATGNGNTALGFYANVSSGNLFHATAIGFNAVTNANDKIVIGTASNLNLTGGYGAWQSFSDGRFKENVQANVPGLTFINKLHAVTYHLNAEKVNNFLGIKQRMDTSRDGDEKTRYLSRSKEVSSQLQTGFIAQEVEETAKSIGYEFDGVHHPENDKDNYTIGYSTFVVPLVKAVQELSVENNTLKQANSFLQQQIDDLKSMVQTLAKGTGINVANSITLSRASLQQNTPNPFNQSTTINYAIPANFVSAQVVITDQSGKVLKQTIISAAGNGMINLRAGSLAPGTYLYSLYMDDRLVDTKKMVLTK